MGSDTLYVEGLKGYVKVHFTSLRSREDKLPGGTLMRLRRSGIAGLSHVAVDAFFARRKQEALPHTGETI